jgi:hypothetical protein
MESGAGTVSSPTNNRLSENAGLEGQRSVLDRKLKPPRGPPMDEENHLTCSGCERHSLDSPHCGAATFVPPT